MKIAVTQDVLDVLSGSRWNGTEDGWVLAGEKSEDSAVIEAAINAGPDSDRGAYHVSINPSYVIPRLRGMSVIGFAHTHPPSRPEPSVSDLAGDCGWVHRLKHGFGVFCIVTQSLNWLLLHTGDSEYSKIDVEVACQRQGEPTRR